LIRSLNKLIISFVLL